jgi:hypothetical protein
MDASDRERLLWGLVFSVPPGIGMVGFVAVSVADGAVTPTGLAAGGVTTAAVLSLFLASIYFGDDAGDGSGDDPPSGKARDASGDRPVEEAGEWDQAAGVEAPTDGGE